MASSATLKENILALKDELVKFCEGYGIKLYKNDTKEEIVEKLKGFDFSDADLGEKDFALLRSEEIIPEEGPEETKPKEEEVEPPNRFFLITDKESLNRGRLIVNPVSRVRNGAMNQFGDCILEIEEGIVCLEFDGSFEMDATVQSLNQMDGVIELTPKAIEKVAKIGVELGVLEVD